MVVCLERGADCLHVVHCIPKPYRLLLHLNPDWFYLSGNQLTQVVLEKKPLNGCCSSSSSSSIDFLLLLLLLEGATAMLLRCCRFRASRVASTTVTPSSPTSAAMLTASSFVSIIPSVCTVDH